MARQSLDLKRIKLRRLKLERRVGWLEQSLASLKQQLADIDIAERVLQSLAAGEDDTEELNINDNAPHAVMDEECSSQSFTIGEMALNILRRAGDEGCTSTDLLNIIREKWMPNLMRTSLSPPLSRLKTKGVIDLAGDKWKIVPEKEPSEAPPSDGS